MNTFDLGRILEEVHWDEYAEFDNPPHYVKSFHHRLRMRKIMNQAVSMHDEQTQRPRIKLSPRKVIILLVLIFTAIITAAAIVVWYGNIYGQRHSGNTELFAVVDGAPEVIEEVYELTYIPEGFEFDTNGSYGDKGDISIVRTYVDFSNDISIIFEQSTRNAFTYHLDIERANITEIEINGRKAVVRQSLQDGKVWTFASCDVVDYILSISTCLPTENVLDMLKSTKIKK